MTTLSGEPPLPNKAERRTRFRQPIDPLDDEPASYDHTLRKKTRWSILWTVLRILSDQVFSFIVFVVLARLLSPADFGIYTVAQAVAEIGRAVAIGGMVQNIPRTKKLTPALADTVFWTNLVSASILALGILLLSPPIMNALELSHATGPVQGLGFVLPLAALGATHMSLRLREFGHKSLALRSVVSGTIGGAAGIAAAFLGWGIWALVVQRLVTEATNAVVAWQAYPWIPGRNFSMEQLRATWKFGFNISLQQILSLMPRRAMDFVLGLTIGAAAVGLNRTARRTEELVIHGTVAPFTVVALQTLSRLQSDSAELSKAYHWMLSKSAMLSCPALVGLGAVAPEAIPMLFGEKWETAGVLAQIMSFMVVPYALSSFTPPMMMALGRSATLRTFALLQVITTALFALAAAPFGLTAVVWVSVLRAYLALPLQLWMLRNASGIPLRVPLLAITPPLTASVIMGAIVWTIMHFIDPLVPIPLVQVGIGVAAGATTYPILLLAISKEARSLARHQARNLRALWVNK